MKKILSFIIFIFLLIGKTSFAQCPTAVIEGPASGCTDIVGSFRISGGDATLYTWTITGVDPRDITAVSETERFIIFGSNATITITATPSNGSCAGTPITKTVTVSALPSKPQIKQTGDVLRIDPLPTTGSFSYQWYLNDLPIPGATANTYTITQTGFYDVEAKNTSNCSIKSDRMSYFTTSVKEDAKFKSFSFFPNPVREGKITTSLSSLYDIEFFTLSGKKLIEKKSLKGEEEIDLSGIDPGVYILRVISEGKTATRKIIIQ